MRRREFLLLAGGAIAGAPALRAQQKTMPVIGYLGTTSPMANAPGFAGFRRGLSEAGYIEDKNVAIEYRLAEGHVDRLPALAADLVSRKVDLITAFGGIASVRAAKNATSSIPIVFLIGTDPVADGLVASLARPGGNLTGVSILIEALYAKRLELLTELVPQARIIALLVNPHDMNAQGMIRVTQEAASARGVQLKILKANSVDEINAAFGTLTQQPTDALLVGSNPYFDNSREQLLAMAARHAVPAMYWWRAYPAAGGLISYGVSLTDASHQVGIYAGKILNGAKPADLPVQQPTKFELVVNFKTAKALGLTIPPSILARADEIIE